MENLFSLDKHTILCSIQVVTIEAPAESALGWIPMELRWEDFHRADWEENAGAPFAKANELVGIAFGMNTLPDASNVGSLRVDDIGYLGAAPVVVPTGGEESPASEEPSETEEPGRRGLPCGSALILPLFALVVWSRRRARTVPSRRLS